MRVLFGAVGLLVVLAIVGVLAKKQLGVVSGTSGAPTTSSGVTAPSGTPQQQVRKVQQSVESAMQQARPSADADDTK